MKSLAAMTATNRFTGVGNRLMLRDNLSPAAGALGRALRRDAASNELDRDPNPSRTPQAVPAVAVPGRSRPAAARGRVCLAGGVKMLVFSMEHRNWQMGFQLQSVTPNHDLSGLVGRW